MYLNSTLYERAPHYWILVGILLVILGIDLGVQTGGAFLIVGVTLGLASCAWGLRILLRRAPRTNDSDVDTSKVSAD